jgi:hypothetical protein
MQTTTSYAQWFVTAVGQLADRLDTALRATNCAPHYVWFKPHGLEFTIGQEDERPEGFELATGEAFRGDLSRDQMAARLHGLLSRVPVLPGD